MTNEHYEIPKAYVFQNENVSGNGEIVYYPICMLMFVEHGGLKTNLIYKLDQDVLK